MHCPPVRGIRQRLRDDGSVNTQWSSVSRRTPPARRAARHALQVAAATNGSGAGRSTDVVSSTRRPPGGRVAAARSSSRGRAARRPPPARAWRAGVGRDEVEQADAAGAVDVAGGRLEAAATRRRRRARRAAPRRRTGSGRAPRACRVSPCTSIGAAVVATPSKLVVMRRQRAARVLEHAGHVGVDLDRDPLARARARSR